MNAEWFMLNGAKPARRAGGFCQLWPSPRAIFGVSTTDAPGIKAGALQAFAERLYLIRFRFHGLKMNIL